MNKQDMINSISATAGLTKGNAEIFINSFVDVVTDTLAQGESVYLAGFGKFEVKERTARIGRNPKTGEEISIPAKTVASFKVGKSLKDTLSG